MSDFILESIRNPVFSNQFQPPQPLSSSQIYPQSLDYKDTCSAWEKFKNFWRNPTQLEQRLSEIGQMSSEDLNAAWNSSYQEELLQAIEHFCQTKAKPHSPLGKKITLIVAKLACQLPQSLESNEEANNRHLNKLLQRICEAACNRRNFNLMTAALSFLTLEQLEMFTKDKIKDIDTAQKLVEYLKKRLPPNVEEHFATKVTFEVKRSASVVINFFPNLLDVFIRAFSLENIGRGPRSVWDFSAMLEIYYKVFMIPHAISVIVGAFLVVTWEVYLVTAVIVLIAAVILFIYLKWFRPCPGFIPNTENLTHLAKIGELKPVIHREAEIQQVISFLGTGKHDTHTNVLLVGKTGVGKTEIIKGVAQRFKGRKIFTVNTANLYGEYTGAATSVRDLRNYVRGYEKEVVFVFEEIHVAVRKGGDLAEVFKTVLDRDGIQCIGTTTLEGLKEIQNADKEGVFQRRFPNCVLVNPTTFDETLSIIQDEVLNCSPNVAFEDGILDVTIQSTDEKLPMRSQPSKAVDIFKAAISHVEAFNPLTYKMPELLTKELELQSLTGKHYRFISDSPALRLIDEKMTQLEIDIQTLEKKNQEQRDLAFKIRNLIREQKFKQDELARLTIRIAKSKKPISKKVIVLQKKILFINHFVLPCIKKTIENDCELLNKDITIRVTKGLIEKLIADKMVKMVPIENPI